MHRLFRYRLFFFLPCLVMAQYEHHLELPEQRVQDGDVRISLSSGVSRFVTARNRFLEGTAAIRTSVNGWEIAAAVRMNNQVSFELPSPASALELTGNETIFIDPNFVERNETFQISKPFLLSVRRDLGAFTLSFDLSPVIRSEHLWTPIVDRVDSSTFLISSFEQKREQGDLTGGLLAQTMAGPMALSAGVTSLSFGKVGDPRVASSGVLPVFGLGVVSDDLRVDAMWNTSDIHTQFLMMFPFPELNDRRRSSVRLQANRNARDYTSSSLSAMLSIPVSGRFELIAGYSRVWAKNSGFSATDLQRWYGSISPPWDDDLETRLPHSSVKVGVQYELRQERRASDVQLVRCDIRQRDLYFSKRDYYAYNPVGTVTVRNTAEHPSHCQFVLEIDGGTGSYRTGVLTMQPGETREIPLYLYLAALTVASGSEVREADLRMLEGEKEWDLATVPMNVHEAHHWDGDTRNLHFFLTPEDPLVIDNARRLLITAAAGESLHTGTDRQFVTLAGFITALGKGMSYVSDPTSAIATDRVQYPSEMFASRAGDCEDLVVYTASHLMSVGFSCAVVDITPVDSIRNGGGPEPGHVFLLVDTGIGTDRASDVGLTDNQWVARRSVTGAVTMWIPLETTVLEKGFDAAFRMGTAQYHRAVIAPEELDRRTVHVIDF